MTRAPDPGSTCEDTAIPPAPPAHDIVSDAEAPTLPAPNPPGKRIAFLVIHGIGQQRPYETLDQFGRGLLESFENDKGAGKCAHWAIFPELNICTDPEHIQKDWVRASYRLAPDQPVAFQSDSHQQGTTIQDVSLFEYYWAPITQDKITYTGSLLFLIKAGFQPFLYWAANVNAILKTDEDMSPATKAARIFKVILKEFVRQTFLFLPLILLLAGTLVGLSGLSAPKFSDAFKHPSAVLILTVVFVFIRYLYAWTSISALWESVRAESGWQTSIYWRAFLLALFLFNVIVYPFKIGWLLTSVARAGTGLVAWHYGRWISGHFGHWSTTLRAVAHQTADMQSGWERLYWFLFLDHSLAKYFTILVWLGIANFSRSVLINFVGDVAVYVNASELAKNFAARAQILDECTAALTTILKLRIDPKDRNSAYAYDQVYVAGHSLGSVIAYDTINLLLDRARTGDTDPKQIQAIDLDRLRGMVTFGSPLNKIFYFFRERTDPRAVLRNQTLDVLRGFRVLEGLKDSVTGYLKFKQPTNTDWKTAEYSLDHNFRWINAYSVQDPISGRLVFYDLQGPLNQKRFNYVIPGLAHLGYWKDTKFYTFVRERLL